MKENSSKQITKNARYLTRFHVIWNPFENPHGIPTDTWGFIIVPIPIPHAYPWESPWESPYPRQSCMSSQSHVSHCRVLPLGEFTVLIPEPHATLLQGAVTWRNQCHDHGTLQGVIIPSAILKIVFAIFYYIFVF